MAFYSNHTKNKALQNYKDIKNTSFDFERIALFFANKEHQGNRQILSDLTLRDLDFEELFMLLDRTCSSPGQQFLYATLREIPENVAEISRFEPTIEFLQRNQQVQ